MSLIKSKKINMKQLSGLTYNTNDSELKVFPLLDNTVKKMLNRFKICQGDVVSKNTEQKNE